MAAGIATACGATVIAETRSSEMPAPASVDVVLAAVAGPAFASLVAAPRPGGHYCMYGAAGGGDIRFDAWNLIEPRTLTGYSSETLTGEALRAATRELLKLSLPSAPKTLLPLTEARRAHSLLEKREVRGRILLIP